MDQCMEPWGPHILKKGERSMLIRIKWDKTVHLEESVLVSELLKIEKPKKEKQSGRLTKEN